MPHIRFRDDESPSRGAVLVVVGALAGLAAGVLLAQRVGGLSGLGSRVRQRFQHAEQEDDQQAGYDYGSEGYDDLDEALTPEEELEERVLEAFRNDPVLGERAVDIGAISEGIIELTGWVHAPGEMQLALTITRGVPGVATVINRLTVREEEDELDESASDYEEGAAGGHWEGQQVGTGRRRQGSSTEPDRHTDPKVELEDRWLSTGEAVREAADDIAGLAERRKRGDAPAGDRTGGAPVAPTGVPKADHVVDASNNRNPVPGRPDQPSQKG
jgi:hypothetical protein